MSTTRIQLRGDTAANWSSANPVLADREIGLEIDTKKFKIGNGSLSWNSLDYFVETPILSGGTNINLTNDYEINLDDNVSINSFSATTITVNDTGDIIFKDGSFRNTFGTATLTNDRTIVLPNSSGTLALTSQIPTTYPYDLTVAASDETTAITTGTSKVTFYAPRNFTLTSLVGTLTTTGSTDSVIDVNYNGSSVLASPLTIPAGEYYTATTTSTSSISQYGRFTVDIDTAGTGAAGIKVVLLGTSNL